MDRISAGRRLQLSYIHDPLLIEDLRRGFPVDDTLGVRLPPNEMGWAIRCKPGLFDHLLLASDRKTGACEAVVTASDQACQQGSFLYLDTCIFAPTATPIADRLVLPRRMLALMMARAYCRPTVPGAIVVRTRSRALSQAVQAAASRIDGAVLYPDPKAAAIPLATGSFAHRIARLINEPPVFDPAIAYPAASSALGHPTTADGTATDDLGARPLIVLDLRFADREAVLQTARRLYRARIGRASSAPPPALRRDLARAV